MDVLSDVLSVMRTGRPYAQPTRCHAPWGVRFPAGPAACCHVVLHGDCLLIGEQGPLLALAPGDVLFTPHGDGHTLADRLDSPTIDFAPGRDLRSPGGGPATELLCASYLFDRARPHPLLGGLPPIVHVPSQATRDPLRATIGLLGGELEHPSAGTAAAVPPLIDLLLLYVLRTWFEENGGGWATALHDPAIATALSDIHRNPGHRWTVADLAAHSGLSRATFAQRFAAAVGRPPLNYLTWWRMTTAARLLAEPGASVRSVAKCCGYHSEFAFAKAFKREFGIAPGHYRRTIRT